MCTSLRHRYMLSRQVDMSLASFTGGQVFKKLEFLVQQMTFTHYVLGEKQSFDYLIV